MVAYGYTCFSEWAADFVVFSKVKPNNMPHSDQRKNPYSEAGDGWV